MERELKLVLASEEAWRAARERLGPPRESVEQENVYLDTADGRVAHGRCMLRLRREDGRRELTFKRGVRAEAGYFQAEEIEAVIPAEVWDRLVSGDSSADLWRLEPLAALAGSLGRAPLAVRGSVHNLRLRFPLPGGEVLELDRTRFPGGREDFEIEVETADPERVRAWVEERLPGLVAGEQTRTKYERFLASL